MIRLKYLALSMFSLVLSEEKLNIQYDVAWEKGVDIDVDSCDVYTHHEDYDECSVNLHPNDIDKRYSSTPLCCGDLAYTTISEKCDGSDKDGKKYIVDNVHVCHHLSSQQQFLKPDFGCPNKCTLDRSEILMKNEIEKLQNGSNIIKRNGLDIKNFCLSYDCEDDQGWKLSADICKCPDEEILQEKTKELEDINTRHVSPCCDMENEIFKKKPGQTNEKKLVCDSRNDTNKTSKKALECQDKTKYRVAENIGKANVGDQIEKLSDDQQACVGVLSHFGSDSDELILDISMLTCEPVCNKHTPCFRYCCGKDEYYHDGTCIKSNSTIPEREKAFHVLEGLTDDNKEFSSWNEPCDFGEKATKLTCASVDVLPSGSLKIKDPDLTLNYGQFCVANQNPTDGRGHYFFQACVPIKTKKSKLTFYPHILCVSAGFLLLTVLLYLLFPPLINHYTKIMMNFSASMFFAFLVLIIAQKPEWFPQTFLDPSRDTLWPYSSCVTLAFLNQYFFLAAFTWMTIMSYEIFNQLKGLNYGTGEKGIMRQLIVGYGTPFLICLITIIVEFTAPMCASYRPKFGHKGCLFHGGIDKFIWFLFPILVMLLLNTAMFLYVLQTICKTSLVSEMTTGSNRQEKLDKAFLYLRLFLGMGITWYFEILSYAVKGEQEWYFTDILNMFQGVYVFVIFVCKRNVVKVILKKKNELYTTVRRSTGVGGARPLLKMMSQGSRSLSKDDQDRTDAVTVSYRLSPQPNDDQTKV